MVAGNRTRDKLVKWTYIPMSFCFCAYCFVSVHFVNIYILCSKFLPHHYQKSGSAPLTQPIIAKFMGLCLCEPVLVDEFLDVGLNLWVLT